MKKNTLFLAAVLLLAVSCKNELTLVNSGKATSVIIIPENAGESETKAAEALKKYIFQISGAEIKIKSDKSRSFKNEILIGKVNRSAISKISFEELQKDGFRIINNGKKMIIAGGSGNGVLYGVYTFLENYLGCRKYTSKVSYIPQKETITLEPFDITEVPHFTYREVYYRDVFDEGFMDWHKLHCHGEIGKSNEWGFWCHSFGTLVPVSEYGKTNPEYYGFYNDKRNPGSQLCLTNPDVYEILVANLKKEIDKKPGPTYWSVSQDDHYNHCRCPECLKLNEAAGSPMGSLLTFVNKVASEFPDKTISTLAYQYSRKPPKGITPNKNVNIMLCNIESLRHVTIEKGDSAFCSDMIGWGKLTNNIILWDYVIQFSNLLAPFPNLRILQPNVQLMKNNNVTAVFEQGNRDVGGEMAELRAYMLSKLLWNPDLNMDELINDFLNGYYGNASGFIKEYIDLVHNSMEQTNAVLDIFSGPVRAKETFLSKDLLKKYQSIFEKAESSVADKPDVLLRVKSARLPVYYSELEIAKNEKTGERGSFEIGEKKLLKPNAYIEKILDEFLAICTKAGVSRVTEWHTTPQEYVDKYKDYITKYTDKPLSAIK